MGHQHQTSSRQLLSNLKLMVVPVLAVSSKSRHHYRCMATLERGEDRTLTAMTHYSSRSTQGPIELLRWQKIDDIASFKRYHSVTTLNQERLRECIPPRQLVDPQQ
jgi:hypothetical protein